MPSLLNRVGYLIKSPLTRNVKLHGTPVVFRSLTQRYTAHGMGERR